MSRLLVSLSLFLGCVLWGYASSASAQDRSQEEVPRKILAFYDPASFPNGDYFFTDIHQIAEMPLNHLGMTVVYRSVNDPLPSAEEMKGVRGIMTWFRSPNHIADADHYCGWLSQQIDRRVKLVILGNLGINVPLYEPLPPACDRLMAKLGVRFEPNFTDNPLFMEVVTKDSSMVEFERPLSFVEDLSYDSVRPTDPKAKVYLTVRRRDLANSDSAMVLTTPQGGYVHSGYVIYEMKDIRKRHWRIDPFRFFEEAFGLEGLPIPDTTTINGHRIFYSQIDGDGLFNVSDIDRKSFSGEIILEQVLKKYASWPIMVSLITGYFDQPEYKSERADNLYRNIFSLPNVQPSAHGYAHPLDWDKGTLALTLKGYRFDPLKETIGSMEMMTSLLKRLGIQKPLTLYQWTGNCKPSREQMVPLMDRGYLQINGGDSRFDSIYDSYSFVAALGLDRGGYFQVYSSNSNENTYTNLWKGPYYGYRILSETLDRTESPRRIKPIDIYYHFYSGEKQASLATLLQAYDHALRSSVVPLFASDYPRIVLDFVGLRIWKKGDGFRIENKGDLRTVRFEIKEKHETFIDWNRSIGIDGYWREKDVLYVHLSAGKEHEIYFSSQAQASSRPYLQRATFQLKDFQARPEGFSFTPVGWIGEARLNVARLIPGASYSRTGFDKQVFKADAKGNLAVVLDRETVLAQPILFQRRPSSS